MFELKSIQQANLYNPSLDDILPTIQKELLQNFRNVSVQVIDCPDLRQFGLTDPGIGGQKTCLIDVGGVPNLLNPKYHETYFNLHDIADRINFKESVLIGAGATAKYITGVNAEYIPCCNLKTKQNNSMMVKVNQEGQYVCEKYISDNFGLLANIFASEGLQTPVIKIKVQERLYDKDFIQTIRESLLKHTGVGQDKQIGMGGVFMVNNGKIRAHVMPDFKQTQMIDGSEVQEWLKYYEMESNLICLSTFVTGDPTNGDMNLRLDHTHFFSQDGLRAGHYHYTTTPKYIEYEGYFNIAKEIFRVDNAYKRVQNQQFLSE